MIKAEWCSDRLLLAQVVMLVLSFGLGSVNTARGQAQSSDYVNGQ